MKNQYFKKDKKAIIYVEMKKYQDDYGNWKGGGYMSVSNSPLWCYARQIRQNLKYDAGIINQNNEVRLFVFNYNKLIKTKSFIKYNNTWYMITRIDTTDDYNGEMFAYVEEVKLGEEPGEEDIKEYNPNALQSL